LPFSVSLEYGVSRISAVEGSEGEERGCEGEGDPFWVEGEGLGERS
jgi:hypothetical protein